MKKLAIVSVLLLTSLQLNGALSRLGQAGRQLAPMLRGQLNTQPIHLPATLPGTTCRYFSSSSRAYQQARGGYSSDNKQHTFGNRNALLFGCGVAGLAAATVAAQDKQDESCEGLTSGRARRIIADTISQSEIADCAIDSNNAELAEFFRDSPEFIEWKRLYVYNLIEKYPESREQIIDTIIKNLPSLIKGIYRDREPRWPVNDPESQKQIIGALIKNMPSILIDTASKKEDRGLQLQSYYVMTRILNEQPEFTDQIIDLTITTIIPNDVSFGRRCALEFLEMILTKYPTSKEQVMDAVNKSEGARRAVSGWLPFSLTERLEEKARKDFI